MRVLWVQDYLRPDGGAEQSNKFCVKVGEELGMDIVGMAPQNFHAELLAECDVVILNNFWHFPGRQERLILEAIYEGRVPYVVYSHDYRDLARPDFAGPLMRQSRLNVFISPRHKADYERALGIDGIAIPLAVDPTCFRPAADAERRKNSAVIPSPLKQGADCRQFVREHRAWTYTALGRSVPGVDGVAVRGKATLAEMPAIYSEHEHMVHFPARKCAGERIIFEAALCGCKIWANSNAGHISWGWDLADRDALADRLEQGPFDFWRAVEDCL